MYYSENSCLIAVLSVAWSRSGTIVAVYSFFVLLPDCTLLSMRSGTTRCVWARLFFFISYVEGSIAEVSSSPSFPLPSFVHGLAQVRRNNEECDRAFRQSITSR